MTIQKWSDDITVVELSNDPQFTDEMMALTDTLADHPSAVVLNFSPVSFVNSSNISLLLRFRKRMLDDDRRLILCGVNDQIRQVCHVTGLDRILEFTDDVMTALATLQLSGE